MNCFQTCWNPYGFSPLPPSPKLLSAAPLSPSFWQDAHPKYYENLVSSISYKTTVSEELGRMVMVKLKWLLSPGLLA